MRVLAVVVVAALSFACGSTRCSVSNCVGCCDANGTCQAGSAANACGVSGFSCQVCALGSSCVNGACGFPGGTGGGGGSTTGGGTGGGSAGGGGGADGGTSLTGFRAFNLALSAVSLPASCFRGTPPSPAMLPARTVEVLVWQGAGNAQFIALTELADYRLGDAPVIRSPDAVQGSDRVFAWLENEQRPVQDQYTEARQKLLRFTFTDLTADSTTGTLDLNAQYACINGRLACPTGAALPPDAASCSVSIPFAAQAVPLGTRWTTPTAPVSGASRYLVAIDASPVRALSVPSCFRNNNLPAGRASVTEQNSRLLDVWQTFSIGSTNYLRTSQWTWKLGDSPDIRVNADLSATGGDYTLSTNTVMPIGASYTETRMTSISTAVISGDTASLQLELASSYSCAAGQSPCPVGDAVPADAASCSAALNASAVRVP